MRVVLDANVLISGLIAPLGPCAAILDAWRSEFYELVLCPGLLAEVAEKLDLPKICEKYHVTEEDRRRFVALFWQSATVVPGNTSVQPPPDDPDDSMIFSSAMEANADFIVTGDKGLLGFAWPGPGQVVAPRRFWEQELPRHVVLTFAYPVYVLEDLSARRFQVVEVEGKECLALFSQGSLAELYRKSHNLLCESVALESPSQLAARLRMVQRAHCDWLAVNPVGRHCIIQAIATTLTEVQVKVDPST